MSITYREVAIAEMLRTVEEAMSGVIEWWGDLPPPMKEAIEQFRTQGLYIVINKWLAGNNFSRPHFHPQRRGSRDDHPGGRGEVAVTFTARPRRRGH